MVAKIGQVMVATTHSYCPYNLSVLDNFIVAIRVNLSAVLHIFTYSRS